MECEKEKCKENSINWVKTLPSKPCPNSIYFLKTSNGVLMYVSSITGVLTQIGGSGQGGDVIITSPDSSINIVQNGQNFEVAVSDILQMLVQSALQPGNNVSELINDAGYLTEETLQNLQSVTNIGSTTTNSIAVIGSSDKAVSVSKSDGSNSASIELEGNGLPRLQLKIGSNTFQIVSNNLNQNVVRTVSNQTGFEVVSVNGIQASSNGNISISTGETNLSYIASPTQGVIASDTGTDATIPLANGTNAGLTIENYTSIEKTKLAGIENQANRLLLGETSTTAYRGDRGKIAYDHSQITSGNPHSTSIEQVRSVNNTISGNITGSSLFPIKTNNDFAQVGDINDYQQQPFLDFSFNSNLANPFTNTVIGGGSIVVQSDSVSPLTIRTNRPTDIVEAWLIRGNASAPNGGGSVGIASQNPMYIGSTMLMAIQPAKTTDVIGRYGLVHATALSPLLSVTTGIYIEIDNSSLSFRTALAAVISAAPSITINNQDWLFILFEVESASAIRCKIRTNGISGTLIYNQVITTNLPLADNLFWPVLRVSMNVLGTAASADYLVQLGRIMTFAKKPNYLKNF